MTCRSSYYRQTEAFTLTELMIVVGIVSILAAAAAGLFPRYVERAKNAEAEIALAEVKRLETDFFARTGTFSSDLNQIGYQPSPPLKYHTIFVQVEKGPRGWSYMVLLMPNGETNSGGSYLSQGPDGRIVSNVGAGGAAASGSASACGAWSGWGSMEGGQIEGEEGLSRSSSGTPPCGKGGRVVQHGRGSTTGAAAK
ncbi:MAG TPA: prepilin-type N-terminal cleavage/methylation domain-containing protein [Nitrospira sp.]|nr:prepilin-type N-terminal cleavage/methylation domain-containing protein [Nitrospira sp.]